MPVSACCQNFEFGIAVVIHKRPQLVDLHRESSSRLRLHLHLWNNGGVVGIDLLLKPAFTDSQASGNPSQGNFFQEHWLNHRSCVITNPSPLWIFHELSSTVTTFVVLVAVASRTVLIDVIGTTVGTLQQRFDHSYCEERKSTSLFSPALFSTSFPKWHYPGLSLIVYPLRIYSHQS